MDVSSSLSGAVLNFLAGKKFDTKVFRSEEVILLMTSGSFEDLTWAAVFLAVPLLSVFVSVIVSACGLVCCGCVLNKAKN